MADTALIVANNLSHNVAMRVEEAKTSLRHLATVYLVTEVAGQSQATVEAKRRDLQRFLTSYQKLYKHDRPDEWCVSVTKAFLKALQQERLAQATLVRSYTTVRHFARRLHRKFPALFPLGCPTDGVKPPMEPTADWKGLTRLEELRLLNAVQTLQVRRGTGTDQGVRNHALLAALRLRPAGLRGPETWSGTSTPAVRIYPCADQRRGDPGFCTKCIGRRARSWTNGSWSGKDDSPALFMTRTGIGFSRREAAGIIRRIAAQANAHLPEAEKIDVSPLMCCGIRFCGSSSRPRECSTRRRPRATSPTATSGAMLKPDRQTLG